MEWYLFRTPVTSQPRVKFLWDLHFYFKVICFSSRFFEPLKSEEKKWKKVRQIQNGRHLVLSPTEYMYMNSLVYVIHLNRKVQNDEYYFNVPKLLDYHWNRLATYSLKKSNISFRPENSKWWTSCRQEVTKNKQISVRDSGWIPGGFHLNFL